MSILQSIKAIQEFFKEILGQQTRVITVVKVDHGWKALCEVLIDPDYTSRKGIGDTVEIYEVNLNDAMEVLGYEIKETKPRASID